MRAGTVSCSSRTQFHSIVMTTFPVREPTPFKVTSSRKRTMRAVYRLVLKYSGVVDYHTYLKMVGDAKREESVEPVAQIEPVEEVEPIAQAEPIPQAEPVSQAEDLGMSSNEELIRRLEEANKKLEADIKGLDEVVKSNKKMEKDLLVLGEIKRLIKSNNELSGRYGVVSKGITDRTIALKARTDQQQAEIKSMLTTVIYDITKETREEAKEEAREETREEVIKVVIKESPKYSTSKQIRDQKVNKVKENQYRKDAERNEYLGDYDVNSQPKNIDI